MKAQQYYKLHNLNTEEEIQNHFNENIKKGFGYARFDICPNCDEILLVPGTSCPNCFEEKVDLIIKPAESKSLPVKKYTLVLSEDSEGRTTMEGDNKGYTALELLGFLELKKLDIIKQIQGTSHVDEIIRTIRDDKIDETSIAHDLSYTIKMKHYDKIYEKI